MKNILKSLVLLSALMVTTASFAQSIAPNSTNLSNKISF
jgi:hypothetical protein